MSFFSSLYSKMFKKELAPIITFCSITNPDVYQVKMDDVKKLSQYDNCNYKQITIENHFTLKPIHLEANIKTINSQLKLLYTFHLLLLFDDQQVVQTVSLWIDNGELKPKKIEENIQGLNTLNTGNKSKINHHNRTLTVPNEKELDDQMQPQNSMYINYQDVNMQISQKQVSKFSHILELEQAIVEFYYNYLQRLSWGIDILQSSKIKQYPYPPEYFLDTKQKFLWLYKIINLLNYQISGIQLVKYNLQHTSVSTPLIKDIATQILQDCITEYEFLQSEITEMIETISSMHVSDALQFYEVYQILKDQTRVLKDFYQQRDRFQPKNSQSQLQCDPKWFSLSKELKSEVEDYIVKIKFLHTGKFRKSLSVPSKNVALEVLRNQLMEYQIDPKGLKNKNKTKNIAFVSTKHSNEDNQLSHRQINKKNLFSPKQLKLQSDQEEEEDIQIVEEHETNINSGPIANINQQQEIMSSDIKK